MTQKPSQTFVSDLQLTRRNQRLRSTPELRSLVRETSLDMGDLVHALFIKEGRDIKSPISTMAGHYQWSIDRLAEEIKALSAMGIKQLMLFGIPKDKDPQATRSYADDGVVQQAIKVIKDIDPTILVISDICCCEYTDHGHCGVIDCLSPHHHVDNDATLDILALQSISHAQAGADIICPSAMMDGQVGVIRSALDSAGFSRTPIFSHSMKYASALYGPFRAAAEGAPKFGNRKTYQADPGNGDEAILEVGADIDEGADIVMIKPAAAYMDVIYRVHQTFPGIPIGAYHVSGEFAMIKAAAERGLINEKEVVLEIFTGLKRAGASIIVNYYSKELSQWLHP